MNYQEQLTTHPLLAQYPLKVQWLVKIVDNGPFFGYCKKTPFGYEVTTASFAHEMGHATVKIMGIEQQLGQMIWNTPGSEITTNDNIFCYGAQCRERNDYRTAIAEYAADAIQAYTEEWSELPQNIIDFLDNIFEEAH